MSRPKNKEELLFLSKHNYSKLLSYINELPEEVRFDEFPKGTLNRNVKDVMAHLHHWHLMLLEWYEIGMKGAKPEIPAPGYTWKTTPDLNRKIREKYKDIEHNKICSLLEKSHMKVMELINRHSNEELYEKKRYKWTGSTSLGAYLVGSTSSHYDWAFKLVKKNTKAKV